MDTGNISRFDYDDSNGKLTKKQKELKRLSESLVNSNFSIKKCFRSFLQYFFATLFVLIAIFYAWFANYPQPALSPILHQWQNMGETFSYNGHSIFYYDSNSSIPYHSNTQTFLYLHGFPTSTHDMYKLLQFIHKRFDRIVAPDFIGFGFSDKPESFNYSIKVQSNLIIKLVKYLQLKNIHILAHDYGDTVAQELLALQKDNLLPFEISTVCMLNGGIFPSKHRPVLMQKLLRMPMVKNIVTLFSNRFLFNLSFSKIFGPNTKPDQLELYDIWTLIRYKDGYRIWKDLLKYIDERFENEKRWVDAIRHSPVPLHFIYGNADPINPPPFDEYYRQVIRNPSIDVLYNIGHYPQMEAPEQVAESYFSFLKRHNISV